MAKKKPTTLYHPDGRTYRTSDPVEITRLKAHGYSDKPAKKQQTATTPTPSSS